MEDSIAVISDLEAEFREECRNRKDTDKKVRDAIKTLERELRDESVSRKTAERNIVMLYDTMDQLCARMTYLEKRLEELETCDDPANCKHHHHLHKPKPDQEGGEADPNKPSTPTSAHFQHLTAPGTPPSPLRYSISSPRIDPFAANGQFSTKQKHYSAGLVPINLNATSPPNPTSLSNPAVSSPSFASPLSPVSPPMSPTYGPGSPRSGTYSAAGAAAAMRALSVANLSLQLDKSAELIDKPNGKEKEKSKDKHKEKKEGKEKDKEKKKEKKEKEKDKEDKSKDKDDDDEPSKELNGTTKRRMFSRKTIAQMLSPPSSPSPSPEPKNPRNTSPTSGHGMKDSSGDDSGETRLEKSKSFQLVRSTSQVLRIKSRSFPNKFSLKIEPAVPVPVFANMQVSDEACVKVIKDITSFLKNYVILPPGDLFQEKSWSEQAVLLKESLQSGGLPDLTYKYQHDPQSVAQFLYEILASSDRGILAKVGQGLVDSVEIDLEEYPSLKYYKLSLLHSLVFLLDEDPHFALFYTLDLLRAFFKIRPEAAQFFGNKFGPVVLKEFPEKAPLAFSTLLVNFSAILEVKEDINFMVKDGRQTVHAGSLERLFEKLLDPYYRDSLFVDTFFLTYDYFVTAEDMLNKFTFYYWLAATGFGQNWKTQLSIRVLVVIKMWIMTHEAQFQKDERFLEILRNFVDSVSSPFQSELAFFRYFASLAYRDMDTEPEETEADVAHGTLLPGSNSSGEGGVGALSMTPDLSHDSDLCASAKSTSSLTEMATSDERSNSALTMYDDDDDSFLRTDSAGTSPQPELSPLPRSMSEANASVTASNPPVLLSPPAKITSSKSPSGSTLSRSSSSTNIFLTKEGKLGSKSATKIPVKTASTTNIFAYAHSTSSDAIPEEPSSPKVINISSSPPSDKHEKKENRKSLLMVGNRKSRSRGNSDDSSLLKFMASSAELLKAGYNPVCNVDPAIVAMHMAVVDQSFLRVIPYSEWLHKSFVSPELSPNFHKMVSKFNDWGRWVCTEILRTEKTSDRANVFSYFVDLIKHSVAINNYNAAAALVGGLSHCSISRLKQTRDKISTKVIQDFDKMTTLFEMGKNYKNYREAVKACKPPVIPYLPLIPKDLIAIEEGNPTVLENALINFHKLRLLAKLVKYVSQIQQPLYVHPPNTHDTVLSEYLRNNLGGRDGLLSEREMMNKSQQIQPYSGPTKV